jgi:chemotaxis protein CheX
MTALELLPQDLKSMVDEIWSSLFDPIPHEIDNANFAGGGVVVAGFVDIAGGWFGRVVVETSEAGAVAIAASMLAAPADTIVEADLADAIGELANIVGGSVKSCVAGHSTLSLPSIERLAADGIDDAQDMEVTTQWLDHPIRVRVQHADVLANRPLVGVPA